MCACVCREAWASSLARFNRGVSPAPIISARTNSKLRDSFLYFIPSISRERIIKIISPSCKFTHICLHNQPKFRNILSSSIYCSQLATLILYRENDIYNKIKENNLESNLYIPGTNLRIGRSSTETVPLSTAFLLMKSRYPTLLRLLFIYHIKINSILLNVHSVSYLQWYRCTCASPIPSHIPYTVYVSYEIESFQVS